MKTRSAKRRCDKFVKRAYNQNPKTIRILWPMIKNIHGESNDFLTIILKTLVANRSLSSVYRITQLVRGFFLKSKPDSWDTLALTVNPKTNWFSSLRSSDLEIIGPILGYFLRSKAPSFCQNLMPKWSPLNNFDVAENIMSICEVAVAPFVVELTVAERTLKQFQHFVHISDEVQLAIQIENLSNVNRSGKMLFHEIRREYCDWAWECLNTNNVISFNEHLIAPSSSVVNEILLPIAAEIPSPLNPQDIIVSGNLKKTRSGRIVKEPKFFE